MLTVPYLFVSMTFLAVHSKPASTPPVSDDLAWASRLDAINLVVLGQLQELDPGGRSGLMRRVLETYRKSLARLMRQLARGRDEGDQAAVRLVAHTLKSSSASVGALALSDACAALELALRQGCPAGLPEQIRRLEAEAWRADDAVAKLLASAMPPER